MSNEARPWSGWRRLWVVLSLVTGLPLLWQAYQPYTDYEYLDRVAAYDARWMAEDALRSKMNCQPYKGTWKPRAVYPEEFVMRNVPPIARPKGYESDAFTPPKELWNKPAKQQLYNISLECPGKIPNENWWWALVPAALMAAVGLTVRWIYRGFRPKP